jgi:phosphoribosylformylglycinamidine synthase
MDGQAVRDAHENVRRAVRAGALHNAHDIAEGGLGVAVAECCLAGGIGARIEVADDIVELFGEAPGRAFVVSGEEARLRAALPGARVIGRVGGERLEIAGALNLALSELGTAREGGLSRLL